MKLPRSFLFLFLAILSSSNLAQNSKPREDVRDVFLVTRVKVPVHQPGQPSATAPRKRLPANRANSRLGVGFTLYQQASDDSAIRVPLTREFRRGDAVRLLIESNVNGYLYVFYTENEGPPKMIYPDVRLNGGRNVITAHVPYEVPSSREASPNARWFFFDQNPATERLYLVVSRSPLINVPIGRDLMAFCETPGNAGAACFWKPANLFWTQIVAGMEAVQEGQSAEYGQRLTALERRATERGLGLGIDAPAPSIIRMSNSPHAKQLVTSIALIHK